jgi:succinate dehydrogenase flavin-adding protein (antitoxin of CptAB toxin-antitoxin module)
MTQDEIIEMARQAGFDEHHAKFDTRIEAFAKLIAEAEREAFKQIIQQTPLSNWFQADVIEAIDKRGQA